MNLHRVSTHVSPIASETAGREPLWPLEIASSPRAPRIVGLSWKHTCFRAASLLAQVYVKVLS